MIVKSKFAPVKVLIIIVSCSVFFLSVNPCCTEAECSDEPKTEQHDGPRNECETCSPFLSCGGYTGFTPVNTVSTHLVGFAEHSRNPILIPEPVPERLYYKIWQPPRMS